MFILHTIDIGVLYITPDNFTFKKHKAINMRIEVANLYHSFWLYAKNLDTFALKQYV